MKPTHTDCPIQLAQVRSLRQAPSPLELHQPQAASRKPQADDYVELHARSAFSFLRGAALPEEIAAVAAEAGHLSFGLADVGGLYGAPRFHLALRRAGVRPIVGAEVEVQGAGSVALLCEDRVGYRNLCRLITEGHARSGKEACLVTATELAERKQGLVALSLGTGKELEALKAALGAEQLYAEVQRHLDRAEERQNQQRLHAAQSLGLQVVAGGGVRHARPAGRALFDALTCIRLGTTLDAAGRRLSINAERHVRTPRETAALFRDLPQAILQTRAIAERCQFTLSDLGYRFPDVPLPDGTSPDQELCQRAHEGARRRYGGPTRDDGKLNPRWARALAQIEHELAVIRKLQLAGYFLVVHDLIQFCNQSKILAQGRGSAANSAVCYSLGITAVDPVGMGLLFERFLSEERKEESGLKCWPDIDIDLPSGDQREKVIQHVYRRYGAAGAAMTANVITYRSRSASREIGKVLGQPQELIDRMAALLPHFEWHGDDDSIRGRAREAGFQMDDPRARLYLELCGQIEGLPRHLGQHSGGMVVSGGRLDEIVPLEPASMPGRVVVQWDKDDCADLGIIKVDLLGLGMMAVLEQAVPLVREHEGIEIDLAQLPANDPGVYKALQTADTVGVFQVESRAQMATLPRMLPTCFYDIVVEVAIIRPGPIVGQMVNPYLERRAGRQPVTYPDPRLEPILKRTLGIPLFQEQLMRMAMVVGGFSAGEADELRRAIGSKRSAERMRPIEARLRAGMTERGLKQKSQEEIIKGITSFALYGFPESHAASFALIVYASAYLKVHHCAAFTTAMLNCWPMGFYSPATLVKDAQRHGVRILPIDVTQSHWLCTLEKTPVRIGLRYVRGLREEVGQRIVEERGRQPYASVGDLAARCRLRREELSSLAEIGALAKLPARPGEAAPTRRAALWQAELYARRGPGLLASVESREDEPSPLPELDAPGRTAADLRGTGLTVGPHLVSHHRERLRRLRAISAAELLTAPRSLRVRVAGHVIVRQRPGSAKGMVFLSLEDETGIANIVIDPPTFEKHRAVILATALLLCEGRLERSDGVTSLKADRFWALSGQEELPRSRDFH